MGIAIMASCVTKLILCAPICYAALMLTGVATSESSSMKVVGFVLLMEAGIPGASQLSLIAIDSGVVGALENMSSLLFYHNIACPITATIIVATALTLFGTA